jgi:uncharacterized protein YbbC (DUF1343 family)
MEFIKGIIMAICITSACGCSPPVKTGLDNIAANSHIFKNKRVGIITNHTGKNSEGKFIVDIFQQMPDVNVTALFGPEHGFEGTAQDAVKVKTSDESPYGVPIYSLYGKTLKPTEQMLENVDVLVFDIQEIGARFYTYVYTMSLSMEAAAENKKTFVVLDRPNPINAASVQGNILDTKFATFVGLYPIPTRYGMTIGELATMFNNQLWLKDSVKADLTVIPMTNYKRKYWYDQTGLEFIKPSPNMPNIASAAVYPGTCLFEGTNISEGRGTDKPFLLFGAPWIDSEKLTAKLNTLNLPGLKFQPSSFTPTFSKFENEKCFGSEIIITDRDKIDTFWTGASIINTIYHMYPENVKWHERHFDRLCGTDQVRLAITEGKPLAELKAQWQEQLDDFRKIRKKYLLY